MKGIYTFYVSSSVFKSQLSATGQESGRIEAFINAADTTEGFWAHIFEGWAYGFGISLMSCLLLLSNGYGNVQKGIKTGLS